MALPELPGKPKTVKWQTYIFGGANNKMAHIDGWQWAKGDGGETAKEKEGRREKQREEQAEQAEERVTGRVAVERCLVAILFVYLSIS